MCMGPTGNFLQAPDNTCSHYSRVNIFNILPYINFLIYIHIYIYIYIINIALGSMWLCASKNMIVALPSFYAFAPKSCALFWI